jgi:hypothetical protein
VVIGTAQIPKLLQFVNRGDRTVGIKDVVEVLLTLVLKDLVSSPESWDLFSYQNVVILMIDCYC